MNEEFAHALARIEGKIDQLLAQRTAPSTPTAAPTVRDSSPAADSDLDSQYGDEVLKYQLNEKWWTGGGTFAGKRMSECTSDYLDAVARANDAQAAAKNKSGDPEEMKIAKFRARTASRAKGWSERIRTGKVTQSDRSGNGAAAADDDIPFSGAV